VSPTELNRLAANIRLLILDVDGVLTDGRLYYGESGEHFRAFHVRDGLGIKLLTDTGTAVAVISGRTSTSLSNRLSPLGVEHIYQGRSDKQPAFNELLETYALAPESVAYMGDDVQDLPVMAQVGLAASVADGHGLVRERAHWVSPSAGGRGAVRELCELILAGQGKWEGILMQHFLVSGPPGPPGLGSAAKTR
jgi:3-deoxy-D-manno-octulosonate 8-phosphate phosphatase (KDO 8-P phosphatase)